MPALDLSTAPACVRSMEGATLQQARDVLRRHRYLYYVTASPSLTDKEYDCLEWYLLYLFPGDAVLASVGSSNVQDYPPYIREGRRPFSWERE